MDKGASDNTGQFSGDMKKEAILHFLMTSVGGYIGIYCVFARKGVFALAQTMNLLYIVADVKQSNWQDAGMRLGGVGLMCLAVITSIFLLKYGENGRKKISAAITMLAVISEGLISDTISSTFAMYPLFFAMPLQWCAFSTTCGYGSSTIFSTNNLRQCIDAYARYFTEKDSGMLSKARFFRNTLIGYHAGALLCFLAMEIEEMYCIWFCLPVLAVVWRKL